MDGDALQLDISQGELDSLNPTAEIAPVVQLDPIPSSNCPERSWLESEGPEHYKTRVTIEAQ